MTEAEKVAYAAPESTHPEPFSGEDIAAVAVDATSEASAELTSEASAELTSEAPMVFTTEPPLVGLPDASEVDPTVSLFTDFEDIESDDLSLLDDFGDDFSEDFEDSEPKPEAPAEPTLPELNAATRRIRH